MRDGGVKAGGHPALGYRNDVGCPFIHFRMMRYLGIFCAPLCCANAVSARGACNAIWLRMAHAAASLLLATSPAVRILIVSIVHRTNSRCAGPQKLWLAQASTQRGVTLWHPAQWLAVLLHRPGLGHPAVSWHPAVLCSLQQCGWLLQLAAGSSAVMLSCTQNLIPCSRSFGCSYARNL